MRFSRFGEKFCSDAGILRLMDDLGQALNSDRDFLMLGGGNPGQIPAMQDKFRQRMTAMLQDGNDYDRMVGNYDGPQGESRFLRELAVLLNDVFGWPISEKNIAVTNGSQTSFYVLFNALAGEYKDGTRRKVLLPLTPEYIGYTDVGLIPSLFHSYRPAIERIDEHTFKYHVDFPALKIDDDVGALCVSRPTNPTGNVLTNDEIEHLAELASAHNVPLIIDGAYGTPFPQIIFTDAKPYWDPNTIVCLSLSKLGLPGVRTGIVVADEAIIRCIAGANAIMSLAPGSFGPALALDMIRTREIIDLSHNVIMPFYRHKAGRAIAHLQQELAGYPYAVHKAEGAIFLWLWFENLPITTEQLYQRLKQRGVLVIAGENFFPGLDDDWQHCHECIRVTYAQDDEVVHRGLDIIAEEVKLAYDEANLSHGIKKAL